MKKLQIIAASFVLTACTALSGCGGMQSVSLMQGISAGSTETKTADSAFLSAQNDFAIALLRGQVAENPGANLVLAPYSLSQTLAMSVNGAKGDTRSELEQVLGGGLSADALNAYFAGLQFPQSDSRRQKLRSANSVWYRDADGFTVKPAFLQTNADCYGADLFSAAFDDSTAADMNKWISDKSGGQFGDLIERIGENEMVYLLNVLCFESEWAEKYEKSAIREGDFFAQSGSTQTAEYMYSDEAVYLWSEDAAGFTKSYKEIAGREYEFCAILPDDDVTLEAYLSTLTADTLPQPVPDASSRAGLPKFGFETDTMLNETLKTMGIETAFSPDDADFTDMAVLSSDNLYLGSVRQTVRIDVDDEGIKAEGVTIQVHENSSAEPAPEGQQNVILNRPFLFMIRDCETQIPLFIGAVQNIG